jgi:hypothetical protein
MSDWNDAILGDFGSSSATGALGGLQAGCNYQVSRWVFGIQADYDWTNANNNNPVPLFPAVTDQTQIKSHWRRLPDELAILFGTPAFSAM